MQEDILIQISNRLHDIRKDKNVTLQQLAEDAGVTKGLVSQIENGRSIPSLPVLVNLIMALGVDFTQFFKEISIEKNKEGVFLKKAADYHAFEKENAEGFFYKRIMSTTVHDYFIDIVLLTLHPGATRPMVTTAAFEFKYLLSGKVTYLFGEKSYELEAGDSIYFDGMKPHVPQNIGNEPAEMLVIYFFTVAK